MSRRHGVSLVEVLVAIVIGILLIGLLLPALNWHRVEHRGRTEQANNLKIIALAFHNYSGANGDRLPPLVDVGTNAPTGAGLQSLLFNVLPYMEHDNIYRTFDRKMPNSYYMARTGTAQFSIREFRNPVDQTAPSGTTANMAVSLSFVPPYPFSQTFSDTYATTSFAANGLVFGGNGAKLPATFVDGTSNTILLAERAQVCDNGNTKTYNLWGYGLYGPSMPAFATLTPTDPPGLTSTGQVAPAQIPPNGSAKFTDTNNSPNTVRVRVGRADAAEQPTYAYAFQVAVPPGKCDPAVPQTPHVGGMLVGLGDGSVRSVSPTISQWTFWAACTPAGQETLYQDWNQ
jgi:type II secretory pathway pseudopilin PulG